MLTMDALCVCSSILLCGVGEETNGGNARMGNGMNHLFFILFNLVHHHQEREN